MWEGKSRVTQAVSYLGQPEDSKKDHLMGGGAWLYLVEQQAIWLFQMDVFEMDGFEGVMRGTYIIIKKANCQAGNGTTVHPAGNLGWGQQQPGQQICSESGEAHILTKRGHI